MLNFCFLVYLGDEGSDWRSRSEGPNLAAASISRARSCSVGQCEVKGSKAQSAPVSAIASVGLLFCDRRDGRWLVGSAKNWPVGNKWSSMYGRVSAPLLTSAPPLIGIAALASISRARPLTILLIHRLRMV